MSKFIPKDNNKKNNAQVKPKLKIHVKMNEEDFILNEYDLAQMISDLNTKMAQLSQAVQGIIDAMNAATSTVPAQPSNAPIQQELKLPKLNKVETSTLDSGTKFYGNNSVEPNIIE